MSKSKHTPEFRAMVAQEYIDGVGSAWIKCFCFSDWK